MKFDRSVDSNLRIFAIKISLFGRKCILMYLELEEGGIVDL